MPIAVLVTFVTVVATLRFVASARSTSVSQLLRTDSHWMLAVFLPSMFLGFTLGLIALNLVAFATPPLRRALDRECQQTRRHSFATATRTLGGLAIALLVLTLVGTAMFLHFVP